MDINYQSYLKVDDLLELQVPLSEGPEHDELLFITIHQVYELWFKQLLHEFDLLQESLESASFSQSNHTLKRVRAILKTLVGQLDILETMTPISFESFRDRLQKASGFHHSSSESWNLSSDVGLVNLQASQRRDVCGT